MCFKGHGTVFSTVIQHGLIYVVKLINRKLAFQVQAYGKSANGLAAPAITGGGPSTSEPTLQLVGAAPEHGGGSNKALSDEENLGHDTLEFPDLAPQAQTDYWKWHWRFGHAGAHRMQCLQPCIEGITQNLGPNKAEKDCPACLHSKMVQVQGKAPRRRATQQLGRIYSNIWGPYQVPTIGGNRYFVTFLDRYLDLFLMEKKSDLYKKFDE